MRITDVMLLGLGGTGSILVEPMTRLLHHHPNSNGAVIYLADGDKFETSNAARQMGCAAGTPKVEAAAVRCYGIGPIIEPIPRYLSGADVLDYLGSDSLVILAVDNHATRKSVMESLNEACRQGWKPESLLVLSPGNDLASGQVLTWARVGTRDITPYPLAVDADGVSMHPEMLNPTDRIPEMDCVEAATTGPKPTTQLITANMMSAAITLAVIQRWLDSPDGSGMVHETGFSVASDKRIKVYS